MLLHIFLLFLLLSLLPGEAFLGGPSCVTRPAPPTVACQGTEESQEALKALERAAALRAEAAALEDKRPADLKERYEVARAAAAVVPTRQVAVSDPEALRNLDTGSLRATLVGERYQLDLDIGREKGTWMPPQWGASGNRIELSLIVEYQEGGVLQPLSVVSNFVDVKLAPGKWQVQDNTARFSLDTTGSERGDVNLPAGTIYFVVNAWGRKISSKKGTVTILHQALFQKQRRIIGTFRAKPVVTMQVRGEGRIDP